MRTRWRATLVIAGVALAVAGCSSAQEGATSTSADSASGPFAPAAPGEGKSAAPEQGGAKVTVPQPGTTDR